MRKESFEYISNYIRSMICDENIIRIIKQNSGIEISKNDFEKIDISQGINGFFYEYSSFTMIKAYEPFLDVIKDMVNRYRMDLDRLLNNAKIYSLQRSVFKSYIRTGHVEREEEPILGETEFERQKFVKGVVNLLLKISEKHEMFILINNANQMCDSTLDVIEELEKYTSYKFKVLLITDEMGNYKSYLSDQFNRFIKRFDEYGLVLDWPFEEEGRKEEPKVNVKNSTEELLCIQDMFYTYAINQAEYYMNIIYQKVELEKVSVSMEYRLKMLSMYIMISVFKENYSYALVLCDKLNLIDAGHLKDKKNYEYYYYKSLANMYIGNGDDASKDAELCIKVAKKLDDDFMIFRAYLLKNMADLAGWKDIWICDKEVFIPEGIEEMCYKYNYLNHLAHIYVYCFDNDLSLYESVDNIEIRTPKVTKGIYITKKLGNDQFLVEAYRKNIMVASYNGYYNTAGYFYSKSIEVVKKNKNRFEEANIYNGLGYNCCTADKFSEANRYYNKALEIFYEEKSSDYIIETLYNMGTNAILAGDYSHALEYLLAVNNILKILKKNSLRVCNISKVFGLIAVAAFKNGNAYTAQLYANKAENFLKYILDYKIEEFINYLWSEDIFLYFYVSALLAERNGKYQEALDFYERAKEHMLRSSGAMFFEYVLYAADLAKLLKKLNREEESVSLLTQARDYFSKKGNFLSARMFNELIQTGNWNSPSMSMMLTSVSIDDIMEQIKQESVKEVAENRHKQIKFFGTFQELINQEYTSVENEIDALITNFRMNFNLDNVLFISCENGEPEIRFSDLEYEISKDEMEIIVDFFKSNTSGFALSKYSNNYQEYDKVLEIFERSKIFSVIGAPVFRFEKLHSIFITFVKISESWNSAIDREVLDEDDFEIYMIVFRQILDAIEKYRLNEKLKQRVITDELTGVYNRNGYYEIIGNMLDEVRKVDETIDATMLYMDLDHFKYYNDTFGHHVGDALLKEFSAIFRLACGDYGKVIRFGGDEFLILLNTTSDDIINEVCESIYRMIKEKKGFIDIVKAYSKKNVRIPKDSKVTCTIGVEVGKNMKDLTDFGIMQRHADAALYYGKNNGRGRVIRYKEVVDEINKNKMVE